jgi:hypothetical protein
MLTDLVNVMLETAGLSKEWWGEAVLTSCHVRNRGTVYKAEVENQLERKIKHLRSDRGGEYFSNTFDILCEEHSIVHERTPPYSP